jgi:undecaprenyl-diphosphatase
MSLQLLTWDRDLFLFLNSTLATTLGDSLWPLITDYDHILPVRLVLVLVWLWLVIRGGRRGRTVALLLIPLLTISDQLNSNVLKELVGRPRPCHIIDGIRVVEGVRLLVDCGPGYSFPSSHAVNNFGIATLLSRYYPRWAGAFLVWAAIVAISRVFVGVHYPLDAVGGAVFGALIALACVAVAEQALEWIELWRNRRIGGTSA